jgi:hypothetical protein
MNIKGKSHNKLFFIMVNINGANSSEDSSCASYSFKNASHLFRDASYITLGDFFRGNAGLNSLMLLEIPLLDFTNLLGN